MRAKPICSVIVVGAVLLAEGSHALHALHADRRPAVMRSGGSLGPPEHAHRDTRAHVRLTSRGDLMVQATGVLLIDVADSIQVTG